MSQAGYQHFDNETKASEGPSLNAPTSVPPTRIVEQRPWRKPRWCNDGFKLLVIAVVSFSLCVAIALIVDLVVRSSHKKSVQVVTSDAQCTRVVNSLLKETKANAVDAAVCGMLCLTVTRPDQTSLSSGGYMLVHAGESTTAMDFQFSSPKNYTELQQVSLNFAVPGLVNGLKMVHKLHGRISWDKLLSYSIKIAEDGTIVSPELAKHVAEHFRNFEYEMKKIFSTKKNSDQPIKEGELMKVSGMADTLKHLRHGNVKHLNRDMLKKVNSYNLNWTENTFNAPTRIETPVSVTIDDVKLYTPLPPSAGVSVLAGLNMLKELLPQANVSLVYHVIAEVAGVALEVRKQLADSHHKVESIMSDGYALMRAKEILEKIKVPLKSKEDTVKVSSPTTSSAQVVVIDHDGEVASVVSSLGHMFGSKVITEGGVIMNDGMNMFEESGKTNVTQPPVYAAPVIALKGTGEAMERTGFAASSSKEGVVALMQVLGKHFIERVNLKDAIAATRMFYDVPSNQLFYDKSKLDDETMTYLQKFYSRINELSRDLGHVMCALKSENEGYTLYR